MTKLEISDFSEFESPEDSNKTLNALSSSDYENSFISELAAWFIARKTLPPEAIIQSIGMNKESFISMCSKPYFKGRVNYYSKHVELTPIISPKQKAAFTIALALETLQKRLVHDPDAIKTGDLLRIVEILAKSYGQDNTNDAGKEHDELQTENLTPLDSGSSQKGLDSRKLKAITNRQPGNLDN